MLVLGERGLKRVCFEHVLAASRARVKGSGRAGKVAVNLVSPSLCICGSDDRCLKEEHAAGGVAARAATLQF